MLSLRRAILCLMWTLVFAPALPGADSKIRKKEDERDILLEKELLGVSLKAQLGGPKVSSEDLAGRTVLFIFGAGDTPKWNEFMVRMAHQYINAAPPGGMVTIFVLPGKVADCKWWAEGSGSPFVSFFNSDNFGMPGTGYAGGPRYILFDGDGKMLGDICHDGRDLSGNSVHTYAGTRFTPESVRKAVEAGSGSVVPAGEFKECADLMRSLVEGSLSAAPLTGILNALKAKAKDGKASSKAEATALLDGFRVYLAHQSALIERNLSNNPALAARALKRVLAQIAGDKEFSTPFDRIQERLKADKAFQEELSAAEMLASLRMQAAAIQWGLMDPDFPQRPKDKVQAIKQGLEVILSKYSKCRAALTAAELKKAYTEWAGKAIDPSPW